MNQADLAKSEAIKGIRNRLNVALMLLDELAGDSASSDDSCPSRFGATDGIHECIWKAGHDGRHRGGGHSWDGSHPLVMSDDRPSPDALSILRSVADGPFPGSYSTYAGWATHARGRVRAALELLADERTSPDRAVCVDGDRHRPTRESHSQMLVCGRCQVDLVWENDEYQRAPADERISADPCAHSERDYEGYCTSCGDYQLPEGFCRGCGRKECMCPPADTEEAGTCDVLGCDNKAHHVAVGDAGDFHLCDDHYDPAVDDKGADLPKCEHGARVDLCRFCGVSPAAIERAKRVASDDAGDDPRGEVERLAPLIAERIRLTASTWLHREEDRTNLDRFDFEYLGYVAALAVVKASHGASDDCEFDHPHPDHPCGKRL